MQANQAEGSGPSAHKELEPNQTQEEKRGITIELEGVPIPAYAIWSTLAMAHSANGIFSYNGESMCHFEREWDGRKFVIMMDTDEEMPNVTKIVMEDMDEYTMRVGEIKFNPPPGEFVFRED